MSFKFKKLIIFILRFSVYGLAAAFLFLLFMPGSQLANYSLPSFFILNNHSFNNAVESAAPAVVNVYASRLYQEEELSVFQNPSLRNLFGIPPTFKRGKTVVAITIIPIPPSHCIIALQIKMLFGDESKSKITVDPVVVIPDILSKKASLKDNFKLESINGKLPNIAMLTHANTENKKAC